MIELEQDNLESLIKENKKVIVQYGAGWCGNCRMIKPKVKKLADTRNDIIFVYADAEQFPGSRSLAKVDNLPTFAAFSDGELVEQKQGNKIDLVEDLIKVLGSEA